MCLFKYALCKLYGRLYLYVYIYACMVCIVYWPHSFWVCIFLSILHVSCIFHWFLFNCLLPARGLVLMMIWRHKLKLLHFNLADTINLKGSRTTLWHECPKCFCCVIILGLIAEHLSLRSHCGPNDPCPLCPPSVFSSGINKNEQRKRSWLLLFSTLTYWICQRPTKCGTDMTSLTMTMYLIVFRNVHTIKMNSSLGYPCLTFLFSGVTMQQGALVCNPISLKWL